MDDDELESFRMSNQSGIKNTLTGEEATVSGPLSLIEMLTVLVQDRVVLMCLLLAGSLATLSLVIFLPRNHVSTTTILPPQQQSAAAGALAQLGAIAGLAGGFGQVSQPDEVYLSLLKTKRIQDDVISKLELKARYEEETFEATRKRLAKMTVIEKDIQTGLISIQAEDRDPVFAARLANEHYMALGRLLGSVAITEAQQRRVFFEKEVEKAIKRLTAAESAFREAKSKSGVLMSEALAEQAVRSAAELRADLAGKEIQIRSMSIFATEANPELQRLRAETGAIKAQLKQIESGDGEVLLQGQGTEAVEAYRSMKIGAAALEMLIKQLELARLDEAKEGPLLQQVDVAEPAEKPSKPKRLTVLLIGLGLTIFVALTTVFARDSWRSYVGTPHGAAGRDRLRRVWTRKQS